MNSRPLQAGLGILGFAIVGATVFAAMPYTGIAVTVIILAFPLGLCAGWWAERTPSAPRQTHNPLR